MKGLLAASSRLARRWSRPGAAEASATRLSRRLRRTWRRPRRGRSGSSPTATRCPTRCWIRSRRPTPTSSSRWRRSTRTRPPRRSSQAASRPTWSRSAPTRWSHCSRASLIRPIDPQAFDQFDKLAFSDAEQVRNENGEVLFAPASAGPHGLIVEHRGARHGDRLLPGALRSAVRRAGGARGDAADGDRRLGAGARPRGPDEPDRRGGRAGEAESARATATTSARSRSRTPRWSTSSSPVRSCSPTAAAGTAEAMADDGLPVEWVAPDEGALSWVCGLAITSKAENTDAAYKLIDYYASPEAQAISAEMGFVAMNPDALRPAGREVPGHRRPAEPRDSYRPDRARERRRLRPRMAGSTRPVGHRIAARRPGRPAPRWSRSCS